MSAVIVLTAEQADAVRGLSTVAPHAALEPVPLADGRFMLPVEVLSDPAHADKRDLLAPLPQAELADLPLIPSAEED